METNKCETHPYQMLQYVCQRCHVLLCIECLIGMHKSHPVAEIREAASIERQLLSALKNEVENSIHILQYLQRNAAADSNNFKTSVENARSKIINTSKQLISLVEKCRDSALAGLEAVVASGSREQEKYTAGLEKKMATLSDSKQLMTKALHSQSAVQTIRASQIMKDRFSSRANTSAEALQRAARKFTLQVVVNNDSHLNDLSGNIRRYIGTPTLAQVGKSLPSMGIMREFRYSDNPDSTVTDMYPMKGGKMCVVFSDNEKGKTEQCITVHNFDRTTFAIRDHMALEQRHVKMVSVSSSLHFLMSADSISAKTISLTAAEPPDATDCKSPTHTTYSKRFSLKKTITGKYSVLDEMKPCDEKEVFKIHADNPFTVCANSTEEYFAVIQQQNASVAIFMFPSPNHFALFQPEIDGFFPADVCFHFFEKEKLLVADEANDAVYIVNFRNDVTRDGRVSRFLKLASGCPWLVGPSALAVDTSGTLWIGCRGGQILRVTSSGIRESVNHEPEPVINDLPVDDFYDDIDGGDYASIDEYYVKEMPTDPRVSKGKPPPHHQRDMKQPPSRTSRVVYENPETESSVQERPRANQQPKRRQTASAVYENGSAPPALNRSSYASALQERLMGANTKPGRSASVSHVQRKSNPALRASVIARKRHKESLSAKPPPVPMRRASSLQRLTTSQYYADPEDSLWPQEVPNTRSAHAPDVRKAPAYPKPQLPLRAQSVLDLRGKTNGKLQEFRKETQPLPPPPRSLATFNGPANSSYKGSVDPKLDLPVRPTTNGPSEQALKPQEDESQPEIYAEPWTSFMDSYGGEIPTRMVHVSPPATPDAIFHVKNAAEGNDGSPTVPEPGQHLKPEFSSASKPSTLEQELAARIARMKSDNAGEGKHDIPTSDVPSRDVRPQPSAASKPSTLEQELAAKIAKMRSQNTVESQHALPTAPTSRQDVKPQTTRKPVTLKEELAAKMAKMQLQQNNNMQEVSPSAQTPSSAKPPPPPKPEFLQGSNYYNS